MCRQNAGLAALSFLLAMAMGLRSPAFAGELLGQPPQRIDAVEERAVRILRVRSDTRGVQEEGVHRDAQKVADQVRASARMSS